MRMRCFRTRCSFLVLAVVSMVRCDNCPDDRATCGKTMVDNYGIDVWRSDLLNKLDFTSLLVAIHTPDGFIKLCSDHGRTEECLKGSKCSGSDLIRRILKSLKSLELEPVCHKESKGKAEAIMNSCWSNVTIKPELDAEHQRCQTDLNTGIKSETSDLTAIAVQVEITQQLFHDKIADTTQDMCKAVWRFIWCVNSATMRICGKESADWEAYRLNALTAMFISHYDCDLGWTIFKIIIMIILGLVATILFILIAYIAFVRYKFSVLLPKQYKERLNKLHKATIKIFNKDTLKFSLKQR